MDSSSLEYQIMNNKTKPTDSDSDIYVLRSSGSEDSVESSKSILIGKKNRSLFPKKNSAIYCDSSEVSNIFSINSFDSDVVGGSKMKVLYDVEEDIITVKKVLIEGWIFKKGSGQDLICSRWWKSRWAELAIVKLAESEIDIPALLIYWDPSNAVPTSFIRLDGAKVESEDTFNSVKHRHRFKIYPKNCSMEEDVRVFSTDANQRDEWVHVVNVAIQDHLTSKYASLNTRQVRDEESDSLLMGASQLCSNVKVRYMVALER